MPDEANATAVAELPQTAETPPEPSTTPAVDLQSLLDSADSAELRRHRKVMGIAGEIAAKQAREIADKIVAERDANVRAETEFRQWEAMDPTEFKQRVLADRRVGLLKEAIRPEIERDVRNRAESEVHAQRQREMIADLSPDKQAELWTAMHPPEGIEPTIKNYTELKRAILKAEAEELAEKRVAEERPRIEREVLAKARLASPSPDLTEGTTPAGALSQTEWDQHRKNPDWRRENRQRIREAVDAGRITS